jgi:hypothetical protein
LQGRELRIPVCDAELQPWSTVLKADVNYLAATEPLSSGGTCVLDVR